MSDCLFCKIANKEINSEFVYEDEQVVAFKDINPSAPHHYLVIPREHISSVNDADDANQALLGRLFVAASKIAREQGIAERGYRCIVNTNKDAGQEVFHIHLHVIGGKPLGPMICR